MRSVQIPIFYGSAFFTFSLNLVNVLKRKKNRYDFHEMFIKEVLSQTPYREKVEVKLISRQMAFKMLLTSLKEKKSAKRRLCSINQFRANALILHPLKIPEFYRFSSVFRGYKIGTLARNGLIEILETSRK